MCRRFSQVFARQAELSDILIVTNSYSTSYIPSILLYVQHQRKRIKEFIKFSDNDLGSSDGTLVLGALTSASSILEHLCWSKPTAEAIYGLSVFKRCVLSLPEDKLSLQALQYLPSLEMLYLIAGTFSDVPSSGHITYLSVDNCNIVSCSHLGVPSLQGLELLYSEVAGLSPDGLAGCASMQYCQLIYCTILASNPLNTLRTGPDNRLSLPQNQNLTDLTQLKDLD